MKWFKHYSDAKYDTRLRRLIKKHGLKGYGLYFFIIETISFNLNPQNPIPDLEDSAKDIADYLGEDTIEIEEIMLFCLNEKLFEQDENTAKIVCFKLLAHLDNTLSSNPEIRQILSNFNKLEETSSNLKQIRLDKNRIDKNIYRETEYIYECDYFSVPVSKHKEYSEIYKDIDIIKQYKKMKIWLDDNPTKRKKNYDRFVSNWLSRCIEKRNDISVDDMYPNTKQDYSKIKKRTPEELRAIEERLKNDK